MNVRCNVRDAAHAGNTIDSRNHREPLQEPTYVIIDAFQPNI
jgi:hypothetical protein